MACFKQGLSYVGARTLHTRDAVDNSHPFVHRDWVLRMDQLLLQGFEGAEGYPDGKRDEDLPDCSERKLM